MNVDFRKVAENIKFEFSVAYFTRKPLRKFSGNNYVFTFGKLSYFKVF